MRRHEAHRRIDEGTLTWGHLKTMLRSEMGAPPRPAVVNNGGMTHEQAVTILAAAIEGREDAEVVCHARCQRPRMDLLMATNILRECSDQRRAAARYCGPCDAWVKYRECPFCGADTDKSDPAVDPHVDSNTGKLTTRE